MMERKTTVTPTIVPTFHRSILVDSVKGRPGEIGRQDRAIILAGRGAPHRSPLTHPHGVPRSCARSHEPGQPATVFRHRQLERGAAQRAIDLGPQDGTDRAARDAHIAVFEYDPQLSNPPRARLLRDLDVGDRLQSVAADRHDGGGRPRGYNGELLGVPPFTPPK